MLHNLLSSLPSHINGAYNILLWVEQSHYRPGQTLRAPGFEAPRLSRQTTREGGKVVRNTHRPLLTLSSPGDTPGIHFC